MTARAYQSGKAVSTPRGLLWGAIYSTIITLGMCAAIAYGMDRGYLQEKDIGYAVMILLIVASYVGAWVSNRKIKRQKAKISLMSGGIYMTVLLSITALFFGGQYNAVPETALLILCGSILAMITGNSRTKRKHMRKTGNYYR